MNSLAKIALLAIVVGVTCTPVMAGAETQPAEKDKQVAAAEPAKGFEPGRGIAIVGACFGAGMCAIGGGYAIARIGSKCIESIARQPEAAGTMFAPMIVSAAMVEGGMLFAIVVCLLGVLGL